MILTIPGLTPGKTYSVQIRSKVDGHVSPWSASYVFEADPTGPLPATPENPTFVVSGDSFYAEWDSVEIDVDGNLAVIPRYEVEFSAGASLRYISVAQQTADKIGYILSFEENRALFGTPQAAVGMRVRSVNSLGFKSDWTTIINATNPAPAPVSGLALDSLIDSISIRWNASTESDVTEYRVQWSDSASGPWTLVYEGSNNSFVHPNVMWNDDSFYRVAALDKFESASTYVASGAIRPQSSFGGDTTPPANATSITATPGFDATRQVAYIDVAWTSSVDTDVSNYLVRYSTDGSSWQYLNVAGDLTGVRIDNLSPGLSYYIGVRAKDFSGNDAAAWSNASPYPVTTAADTTAPSEPSAPTASVGVDRIQVTIAGTKAAGGAMESDVSHYQVHASTTTGFTPSAATQLGVIPVSPAMIQTFHIPANNTSGTTQQWFVKIRAVDRTGNLSPVSSQTTADVDLIQTANIGDAQITNAKIASLEANKITAGTGIINDLSVKSELTIGAASDNGAIKSYDYVTSSGATGFYLSDSGLIIKSGSIEANALNISMGENIIRPEYASFEWSSYSGRIFSNAMLASVNSGAAFNGNKYLATIWGTAASDPVVYLGSSATDYNQTLVVGQKYIISAYVRVTGAVATTVRLKAKDSTGAIVTLGTSNPTTGSSLWTRVSGVYTATTATALLFLDSPTWTNAAGFDVDGIQIERVYGSATTPSQWRPPGITQIDGGTIRTGTIQSTTEAVDIEGNAIAGVPAWSINTAGSAQFGNVNVRGRIIMGDSNDPAVDPVTGAETTLTGLSAMQSYNYVSGSSGWAIKGNGVAEFRQVAADSFDGNAIRAGSMSADRISTGSLNADVAVTGTLYSIEQESFQVTQVNLVSNLANITAIGHTAAVGDRIRVAMEPGDPNYNPIFDTPPGQYDIVTAVATDAIQYARVGANVTTTNMGGSVTKFGRSVVINGDGLSLFEKDGIVRSVVIPTSTDDSIYFSGNINATSINVEDEMNISGLNNSISAGASISLSAGSVKPPSGISIYTRYNTMTTWMAESWADNFTQAKGILVDGTTVRVPYNYFGGHIASYDVNTGAYVNNIELADSDNDIVIPYGITKVGSQYFILIASANTGNWFIRKYNDLNSARIATYNYELSTQYNCTIAQWRRGGNFLQNPGIGTDGTDIFIARAKHSGIITVARYTVNGALVSVTDTNIIDNKHIFGISVGTFDLTASSWVIHSASNNYVTSTSGVARPNEHFFASVIGNQYGGGWTGTKWISLSYSGTQANYTDIAKSGSNLWSTRITLEDADTTSNSITNKQVTGGSARITLNTTNHKFIIGDVIQVSMTTPDATFDGQRTINYVSGAVVGWSTSSVDVATTAATGTVTTLNYETGFSAQSNFTMPRRATLEIVSTYGIGSHPSDRNDPSKVGIYIANNTTGPWYKQTVTQTTREKFQSASQIVFSGTTSPGPVFPASTPGQINSSDSTTLILRGDGSTVIGEMTSNSSGEVSLPRPRYGIQGSGSNITVVPDTWTKVTTWSVDSSIPASGGVTLNSSAGGFHVPRAGLYLVTVTLSFSGISGATGRIGAGVDVNLTSGASYANKHHALVPTPASEAGTIGFSTLVWANASEYIRIWAFHSHSANRTLSGSSASQSAKVVLVSS